MKVTGLWELLPNQSHHPRAEATIKTALPMFSFRKPLCYLADEKGTRAMVAATLARTKINDMDNRCQIMQPRRFFAKGKSEFFLPFWEISRISGRVGHVQKM